MSARRAGVAVAAVLALLLVLGRAWGAVSVDHAWYAALDADATWWWQARSALLLKGVAGALGTLAMRAHLAAVRRSFVAVVLPRRVGDLEFTAEVQERALSTLLWLVALVVGVLVTLPLDDWTVLARALDSAPIGETDPHLLRDVAFYVDILPLEIAAYRWALLSHALMGVVVVSAYALARGIAWDAGTLRVTRHARRHLTVLGAIVLVLLAWSYRIDVFERLAAGTGPDGAFGFADKNVALPAALVLQIVTLSAAAVVGWSGWSRQPRSAIVAVTAVLLAALVLRQGLPLIADQVAGGLDAAERERPYLQARASYSLRAYDAMRVGAAATGDTARLEDVAPWDATTLLRAVARRRPLAGADAGIAWQGVDGAPAAYAFEELPAGGALPRWRPVPLDPRSRDPVALVERADDARPLPPLAVLDGGGSYAIAADPQRVIAGPRLDGGLARLAAAWGLQNPRLALSALPSPGPTLVAVRDVRERIARLAPLLTPGRTVVPVVALDSLWWVAELYAATDRYPLSERRVLAGREVTAAQHAGLAIVNAHTGRTTFVADPQPSPLARAWMRRLLPRMRPLAQLPDPLRAALPPQRDALELEGGTAVRLGTRRVAGGGLELVLPEAGDSVGLVAAPPVWLAARGTWAATAAVVDSARVVRGVLIAPGGRDRTVRWFPVSDEARLPLLLDATRQVVDSLRRGRADVRRGWSRILPATGLVRVVVPLHTVRGDGAPALDAVVVADARHVGVGETAVAAASARPAAGAAGDATATDRAPLQSLYARMRAALARGDFGAFGAAFDALGRALGVPPDGTRP